MSSSGWSSREHIKLFSYHLNVYKKKICFSVCLSVCLQKCLPLDKSNTAQQRLHLETLRMTIFCHVLFCFSPSFGHVICLREYFSAAALVRFSQKPSKKAPLPPSSSTSLQIILIPPWTHPTVTTHCSREERQSLFKFWPSEQNYVASTQPSAFCDVCSTSTVTSQCCSKKRPRFFSTGVGMGVVL